jgi:two-component system sensor histidine kinase QseC
VALAEAREAPRRHALERTLEGCDRATRLVDQLLTLSRLEAGEQLPLVPVDLAELTRSVVAEVAPRAVAKEQSLELAVSAPSGLDGDATLLAVLVRNLVDNAVRYSPRAARIKVRVHQQSGDAVLDVEDGGPGLSPAEIRRLGERFFRVPGSNESGSGLGWSIVSRIAAVHGLTVRVERSAALGGLAVRLIRRA